MALGLLFVFFVRLKDVSAGERKWDIRLTISCSCQENLKNIEKKLKTIGFTFVDSSPFHCRVPSFMCRQRLEFSLSNEDSTSNFSLRSKRQFNVLRHVVEGEDFRYLQRNCTIKCRKELLAFNQLQILRIFSNF